MSLREPGAILLISCYELGHQPLAAASPVGFLRRARFAPDVLDIAVDPFDQAKVEHAGFVGISGTGLSFWRHLARFDPVVNFDPLRKDVGIGETGIEPSRIESGQIEPAAAIAGVVTRGAMRLEETSRLIGMQMSVIKNNA